MRRLSVVTNTQTSQVTRFLYDGDGARVRQVNLAGTTVYTTTYVGATEALITGTQRITKTYYTASTQLIAMRVVTSTGGNVQNYYPFGQIRASSGMLPTDVGFTG